MPPESMTEQYWHDYVEWLRSLSLDDVIMAHRIAQNELLEAIRRSGGRANAD